MPNFISLTCPTCGAGLRINKDDGHFTCEYCGVGHLIKPNNAIVNTKLDSEEIDAVKEVMDKTNSELAIKRLTNEIGKIDLTINRLSGLIEAITYSRVSKGFLIVGISGAILNCISIIGSDSNSSFKLIPFALILIAFGRFLMISERNKIENKNNKIITDIQELEEERHKKSEQLQYHREIVSS